MTRKLLLASAIATALIGPSARALELGALQTESALNQPFSGVIALSDVRPDELDTLSISIASADAFAKAGLERYYFLTQLRFKPEVMPDGRVLVRLSSREPVREPYLDFLVEAVWPAGNLVKGYTVLLDPPSQLERRAPGVQTARAGSATQNASAAGGLPPLASDSGGYLSAPGEGFPYYIGPIGGGAGLWTLARNHAIAGATAAQTAMALYRCNQGAFIRGDINRLIAGKTLVIPSRGELFALDAQAAQQEFQAATRGRAAQRAPLTNVTPDMLSRLRLVGTTPNAGAPLAVPSASSVPAASAATAGASTDVLLAIEASETARQEAVELRNRIKELETQLAAIQVLLQERDGQPATGPAIAAATPDAAMNDAGITDAGVNLEPIATPQSSDVAEPATTALPPTAEMPAAPAPASESAPTSTPAPAPNADATGASDPEAQADMEMLADNPVGLVPVPTPTLVEPTPATDTPTDAATDVATTPPLPDPSVPTPPGPISEPTPPAEPVTAAPSEPPPAPTPPPSAPTPAPEPEPAAATESSTWHSLLLPLAGLAGVTALGILLFSVMTARRRRRDLVESDDADAGLSDTALADEATADEAGSDTATTVSLNKGRVSRFSNAPLPVSTFTSQPRSTTSSASTPLPDSSTAPKSETMSEMTEFDIDSDEPDAFSQADIYIAYGRHRDACKLLENELERSPKRLDLHYKLAEALAAAGDVEQLRERLDHIRTLGGDAKDPAQWARLQLMLHDMTLKRAAGETAPPAAPAPTPTPAPDSTPKAPPTAATVAAVGAGAVAAAAVATHSAEPTAPPPLADVDSDLNLDDSDLADSLPLDFDEVSDLLPAVPTLEPESDHADVNISATDTDSELDSILPLPSADADPLHLDLDDVAESPAPAPLTLPEPVVAPVADGLELPLDLEMPPLDAHLDVLDLALDTLPATPEPVALNAPGVPVLLDDDDVTEDSATASSTVTEPESTPSDLLSSQWQLDSGIWDETATKLDLARAYIEMDDKDAAREILEEVIAEGRDEQRNEARAMLDRLS